MNKWKGFYATFFLIQAKLSQHNLLRTVRLGELGDTGLHVQDAKLKSWRFELEHASFTILGGGPRVVVSTAAFHARAWSSFPGPGGFKETNMFLPHPLVKLSFVRSILNREVVCSASDLQGLNFESCVWWAVSSHSSNHPQEVLLAQFKLYVHKSGLKPDSFHFISTILNNHYQGREMTRVLIIGYACMV